MLVFFILLFAPIPVIVVNVFEETVRLLNKSVGWVAQQEAFLFEECSTVLRQPYYSIAYWFAWFYGDIGKSY